MPDRFYEMICLFIIYSFIGWCVEVLYAAMTTGKLINRGFLSGPYCPIYGVGMLLIIVLLYPLRYDLIFLFLAAVFLTSVLEYLTGILLEAFFNQRWWDYSNMPFNIQGFVCLKFSILWGLGCVFVIRIIHPHIRMFADYLCCSVGYVIISCILVIFIFDLINTMHKECRKKKIR